MNILGWELSSWRSVMDNSRSYRSVLNFDLSVCEDLDCINYVLNPQIVQFCDFSNP